MNAPERLQIPCLYYFSNIQTFFFEIKLPALWRVWCLWVFLHFSNMFLNHNCVYRLWFVFNSQPAAQWTSTVTDYIYVQGFMQSSATVNHLESMDCEQFCPCFFCLSLIRTYKVQVQKAQEQELFPPVKWVCVKCVFSLPGTSKTKRAGFVQAGLCQLSLDFHIFSFPLFSPILILHCSFSLICPDSWRPESAILDGLHLDSMVFAATGWF